MTGALPAIPRKDLLPLFASLLQASVILTPTATDDEASGNESIGTSTDDAKSLSTEDKAVPKSSSGCHELRAFIETFTTASSHQSQGTEGNDSSKFTFLCPALSLHHDTTSSHRRSGKDSSRKEAAEEHARSLLARPFRFLEADEKVDANIHSSERSDADDKEYPGFVTVSCPPSSSEGEAGIGSSNVYEHIPATILQNIVSSFAVLVDSRLHAYAVFLTRHAVAISRSSKTASYHELSDDDDDEDHQTKTNNERIRNIKQKLEMILHLGNQLTVDAMALCFEDVDDKGAGASQLAVPGEYKNEEDMISRSTSQILLRLAIDFRIPLGNTFPSTDDKAFSIAITTPGVIEGSFCENNIARLTSIKMMVDTKHLLDCMIQEASRVVSIVVDIAGSMLQTPTTTKTESGDDEVLHSVDEDISKDQANSDEVPNNPSPPKQHLHRTSSFLAMPPPLPRNVGNNNKDADESSGGYPDAFQQKRATFRLGLDLLSEAAEAEQLRVVTPDMSSLSPNPSSVVIPTLKLESSVGLTLDEDEDKEEEEDITSTYTDMLLDDVSYLSPDQCADIIDTCLFATDIIPMFASSPLEDELQPAAKRARLF